MQKRRLKIQRFNFYYYKQQLGHADIFERIEQKLAQKKHWTRKNKYLQKTRNSHIF